MQIYTNDELKQLNQFPNTPVQIYKMDQLLYFQSNDLKQQFIQKTQNWILLLITKKWELL